MLNIKITSPRISYDITLRKKVTVIRGDSGTGKTVFTKMLMEPNTSTKITISDPQYTINIPRIQQQQWYDDIYNQIESGKKAIFILDDVDYIRTKEFSDLFKRDANNFYIILNRFEALDMHSLGRIPFSIDDIFKFSYTKSGVNILEPYYSFDVVTSLDKLNGVLVEDSNSGFQYFSALNPIVRHSNGKDKVIDNLEGLSGNVLLLVDRAAFGSCFEFVCKFARANNIHLFIPVEYRSFEYMLLCSRLFQGLNLDDFSNSEICNYASHERLYTQMLSDLTSNTAYQYSKMTLSPCYIRPCCNMPARHKNFGNCGNNAMNMPKEDFLLKGTKFGYLIKLVKSV